MVSFVTNLNVWHNAENETKGPTWKATKLIPVSVSFFSIMYPKQPIAISVHWFNLKSKTIETMKPSNHLNDEKIYLSLINWSYSEGSDFVTENYQGSDWHWNKVL